MGRYPGSAAVHYPGSGPWASTLPAFALRIIGGMTRRTQHDADHGVAVETGRPELARPPMYSVIILNDDYTPMDFVVDVLVRFFAMDIERATQVMLHVHTRGRGVCGLYSRDVAESKVAQVNEYSRLNQHPLLCTMEKA